jgi:penicillin amidase
MLAARCSGVAHPRGVPLIRGSDRADLAYATGFVHGQERFFQMDLLRRSAAGELAELFGPKPCRSTARTGCTAFRARAGQVLARMAPAERAFLEPLREPASTTA